MHDPIPRASEVLVFLCVHIGMKVSRACTQIYWTFRSCNLMGDDAHREKAKTNVWREFARELESDKNELLEVVERFQVKGQCADEEVERQLDEVIVKDVADTMAMETLSRELARFLFFSYLCAHNVCTQA